MQVSQHEHDVRRGVVVTMRLGIADQHVVDVAVVVVPGDVSPRCPDLCLRLGHRRDVTAQWRVMAVLIDEPIWWFKGRRWSHLVSDVSYDELHAFAEQAGIPRRGFQGDHYDVPEEYFDDMVGAGALLTPSRELLRRLRGAGLRLSPTERRARNA